MEWYVLAIFLFGGLLIPLAVGVPVSFSLGLTAVVGIIVFIGPQGLAQLPLRAVESSTSNSLLALPLFVLMAQFIAFSGIGRDMFDAFHKWLSRLPGSAAVSAVIACGVFGAACGSSGAAAATMGKVCIPELLKLGYRKGLASGVLAAGGALSVLIPPSMMFIIYAALTDTSVGRLFMAGVMPGILLVVLMSLYVVAYAILMPERVPSAVTFSWNERLTSGRRVFPIVILILSVMFAIYAGIATPTESAALGAFVALLIALARRTLNRQGLNGALIEAAWITCFVVFIIFGASTFGYLLAYLGVPSRLAEFVVGAAVSPIVIVILIQLLYLLLGCLIDPASIMVLTIPIFYPVLQALGVDPIWFGVLIVINMEVATLTPPVGLNLFVIKNIAPPDVGLADIARGSAPFVGIYSLALILILIFPEIALWLPGSMSGR